MSTQSCATCMFGDEQHCYWPYYADGDHDTHDALFDPMPPWAETAIEFNSGTRVGARDCARCPCFEEREDPAEPRELRCPDTKDMFGSKP